MKSREQSDLLLALVLIITCYHQTAYTIGFMGWYDTFRNTKINYYLVDMSLLLAPLIYLYIRSIVNNVGLARKDLIHFIPITTYTLFKMIILIYDSSQPGFDDVQNGVLVINFEWKIINPLLFFAQTAQMIVYLAFSFQLLYQFRIKVNQYFSNTYRLELNWLQNFLMAYSILYVFNSLQTVIDSMIIDLSWKQEWWYYLLSGIAIIYIGVKGYFTKLSELRNVDFSSFLVQPEKKQGGVRKISSSDLVERQQTILTYFDEHKPFLDPDLTLISLAEKLDISREELSDVINQGFSSRFNDFINRYRIDEIKRLIADGEHKSYSLLGLAFQAGFNSKATFNRAFKKAENKSPTEFLESLPDLQMGLNS